MDSARCEIGLLDMSNAFLAAKDPRAGVGDALRVLEGACGVSGSVILRGADGALAAEPSAGFPCDAAGGDRAAAVRAFEGRAVSGGDAGMMGAGCAAWMPLVSGQDVLGVLGFRRRDGGALGSGETPRLKLFAGQLGLLLGWESRMRQGFSAEFERATESFRRAVIDSVSHELKSPLSVIEAALEGLGGAPADASFYLAEALSALRRICRTVDNLLDLARIEGGAVRPRVAWCSPAEICDVAMQFAGDALAGRAVSRADEPDGPLVMVDEALVCQALVNLLHNAAVHTPAGTAVTLRSAIDGGGLCIEVMDRGPGIPPEARARIFEKFIKGPAAPSGCAGIGLAVARGFAGLLGGSVSCSEREGGGAVFRMRIPCDVMAVESSGHDRESAADAGGPGP